MTDQELIRALRICNDGACEDCPFEDSEAGCAEVSLGNAADRLEALLAENEHLREATKMMPQWVSVDEKLPELVKLDDPEGDDWRESKRVFVVTADGECTVATFWKINETFGWTDDVNQTSVTVKAWMTPEPPSTEGVE